MLVLLVALLAIVVVASVQAHEGIHEDPDPPAFTPAPLSCEEQLEVVSSLIRVFDLWELLDITIIMPDDPLHDTFHQQYDDERDNSASSGCHSGVGYSRCGWRCVEDAPPSEGGMCIRWAPRYCAHGPHCLTATDEWDDWRSPVRGRHVSTLGSDPLTKGKHCFRVGSCSWCFPLATVRFQFSGFVRQISLSSIKVATLFADSY